jgi:hypothetical protein
MYYFHHVGVLCTVHLVIYQELKHLHCKENSIYLFQEKELCGLSPNFHIHVPVSGLNLYSQDRSTYFPAVE